MEHSATFALALAVRALKHALLLTALVCAVWLLSGTSSAHADDHDHTGPEPSDVLDQTVAQVRQSADETVETVEVEETVEVDEAVDKIERVTDDPTRPAKRLVSKAKQLTDDAVGTAAGAVDEVQGTLAEVAPLDAQTDGREQGKATPQRAESSSRQGVSTSSQDRRPIPAPLASRLELAIPAPAPDLPPALSAGVPRTSPTAGWSAPAPLQGPFASVSHPGCVTAGGGSSGTTSPVLSSMSGVTMTFLSGGPSRPAGGSTGPLGPEPAFAPGCTPD